MRLADFIAAVILVAMSWSSMAEDDPELAAALAAHDSRDYQLAYDLLLPLAEAGNSTAQSRLAHMYYWGEGRAPDYEQHFKWSLRSAESGNPIGQFDVATDYFAGRGVAMDIEEGLRWTIRAAQAGDDYAQFVLGMRYLMGHETPVDPTLGSYYLELATDQNEPRALTFAGYGYVFGLFGLTADFDKGMALIERAAEHHHAGAQMSYGSYLAGRAVSAEDWVEALKWLILSDKVGCEQAAAALQIAQASVDEEVASRAAEQAELWLATRPARAPHDHRNYKESFCETAPLPDGPRVG